MLPVKQVSRGCWREHAATASATRADDRPFRIPRYHRRGHTKKQTRPAETECIEVYGGWDGGRGAETKQKITDRIREN